jgi:hypothetical protein
VLDDANTLKVMRLRLTLDLPLRDMLSLAAQARVESEGGAAPRSFKGPARVPHAVPLVALRAHARQNGASLGRDRGERRHGSWSPPTHFRCMTPDIDERCLEATGLHTGGVLCSFVAARCDPPHPVAQAATGGARSHDLFPTPSIQPASAHRTQLLTPTRTRILGGDIEVARGALAFRGEVAWAGVVHKLPTRRTSR